MSAMECYETEHYRFHYRAGTKAAQDIREIAAYQENCFQYICAVLQTKPDFKIEYFLCDSPEEVGQIYGDNEPCNGFAAMPNQIYAVYNEKVQCIGFHEDAHLISFTINRPHCPAITEGLAMYFDRKWWGITNFDWTGYFIKIGRYISFDRLLDRECFFQHSDAITYPIVGAFTEWLVSTYGIKNYVRMYAQQDMAQAMTQVYGQTPEELNAAFVSYVGLFNCDDVLEKRMQNLFCQSGM